MRESRLHLICVLPSTAGAAEKSGIAATLSCWASGRRMSGIWPSSSSCAASQTRAVSITLQPSAQLPYLLVSACCHMQCMWR